MFKKNYLLCGPDRNDPSPPSNCNVNWRYLDSVTQDIIDAIFGENSKYNIFSSKYYDESVVALNVNNIIRQIPSPNNVFYQINKYYYY